MHSKDVATKHLGSQSRRKRGSAFAELLDAEIRRYQKVDYTRPASIIPWFPSQLESKFNADTNSDRSRDLLLTMSLGCFFFFLSTLTDFAFTPDIGLIGLALRLAVLPFVATVLLFGPRVQSQHRELLLAFTAFVAVAILSLIPFFSAAVQAPFSFTTAMLAMIYANTTLGLRFRKACYFTLFSCLLCGFMIVDYSRESGAIGAAIILQLIVAGTFSLFANYRIERSVRLGYLLDVREGLRLKALSADREKLRTLSNTDVLTGVGNRGSFNSRCAAALADPANAGASAGLLMIDVDHFKAYNDYYGHVAGDRCLRAVAKQISASVRGGDDVVARYGGEEFVVFLLNILPDEAEALAKRICAAVNELRMPHLSRADGIVQVTVSVGVATTVIGAETSLIDLVEMADRALYAAKRKGRNRYEAARAA